MNILIGILAWSVGFFLILLSLYIILSIIPKKISDPKKEWETGMALFAFKILSSLVVGGLILIILAFLYMMEIIPSFWWT